MPDERPDPIDVAIVLITFGPGIKTLSTKNPNAGNKKVEEKRILIRLIEFFHNE